MNLQIIKIVFKIALLFGFLFIISFWETSIKIGLKILFTHDFTFGYASILLCLAIVVRVVFSVASFLFFRKVKEDNILMSLLKVPLLDFGLITIPAIVLLFFKSKNIVRTLYNARKIKLEEVQEKLVSVLDTGFSIDLTSFQTYTLIYLLMYVLLAFALSFIAKIKIDNTETIE